MVEMMSKEFISIVKGINQTTVHILLVFEDYNDGFPEKGESFTRQPTLEIGLKQNKLETS